MNSLTRPPEEKMKYTKYKLSEPQLKRLFRLAAGFHSGAGNSMIALEKRGFVRESNRTYPYCYEITELGEHAVKVARAEGL